MKKFIVISGPCVLESLELGLQMAEFLKNSFEKLSSSSGVAIDFYFKGSFDKANRSHRDSYRGPGLELGMEWFRKIKEKTGVKTLTDFHEPSQASVVAEVMDVLQIPAFLCRQTDMLVAAADAAAKKNRIVNVKKGQFMAPWDVKNIWSKFDGVLPVERVWFTERGSSFGYGNLVVDMTSFARMKENGAKITIFDGTHAVQKPSQGQITLGERQYVPLLTKASVAAGADGIFWECHPKPAEAKSDAANCLALDQVPGLLAEVLKFV